MRAKALQIEAYSAHTAPFHVDMMGTVVFLNQQQRNNDAFWLNVERKHMKFTHLCICFLLCVHL